MIGERYEIAERSEAGTKLALIDQGMIWARRDGEADESRPLEKSRSVEKTSKVVRERASGNGENALSHRRYVYLRVFYEGVRSKTKSCSLFIIPSFRSSVGHTVNENRTRRETSSRSAFR